MPNQSPSMYQLIAHCDADAHAAPMLPCTPARAREVMQIHVARQAKDWPRKAAAADALVEAGRMVLTETRLR